MIQTQFMDINRYWRTGGVNVEKLKQQKIVGICAGIGDTVDSLLIEHTELCLENNIPFFTYLIPRPSTMTSISVERQAEIYFSWPNVKLGRTSIDIEYPKKGDPRIITSNEGFRFVSKIEDISGEDPLGYSNVPILKDILGMPSWLSKLKWWIAQYYYENGTNKFTKFSTFLARYSNRKPGRIIGTILENITLAWQFTDKLDAQYYLANAKTKDPVNSTGILDGDGNVGLVDEVELLTYFHVTKSELTDKEKLEILWADYLERKG